MRPDFGQVTALLATEMADFAGADGPHVFQSDDPSADGGATVSIADVNRHRRQMGHS